MSSDSRNCENIENSVQSEENEDLDIGVHIPVWDIDDEYWDVMLETVSLSLVVPVFIALMKLAGTVI